MAERVAQAAREVDPVERKDHVGRFDGLNRLGHHRVRRRGAGVERVIGREAATDLEVADHFGIERLCERDTVVPAVDAARHAPHQDDGVVRGLEDRRRVLDEFGRRCGIGERHETGGLDRRERLRQPCLLHLGIEIDVDRPFGRCVRDPGGAYERLAGGGGGGGLVVPFGVVANDRSLIARGVNPVDPRPALDGVHRTGRAEDDDRLAIAPSVEDRHGGVEQPDVGMHGRGHGLAGYLGVALGDGDRAFLVQTEQHLRRLVAQEVDDRIVQPAIARAGIEREIGNVERAQHRRDAVAAPVFLRLRNRRRNVTQNFASHLILHGCQPP